MKNSNIHATLSDLHRLLSTHTSEDFARASEYHGLTPHLREALRALSRETGKTSVSKELRESRSNRLRGLVRKAERPEDTTSGLTQKPSLVSMLQQQPRFASTQSILQFAKELGLNIEPRHKESRERLANRVADAILQQTIQRQSQIVGKLISGAESQTQGWLNVIKGSRS
jgi:hypothetical protein